MKNGKGGFFETGSSVFLIVLEAERRSMKGENGMGRLKKVRDRMGRFQNFIH